MAGIAPAIMEALLSKDAKGRPDGSLRINLEASCGEDVQAAFSPDPVSAVPLSVKTDIAREIPQVYHRIRRFDKRTNATVQNRLPLSGRSGTRMLIRRIWSCRVCRNTQFLPRRRCRYQKIYGSQASSHGAARTQALLLSSTASPQYTAQTA